MFLGEVGAAFLKTAADDVLRPRQPREYHGAALLFAREM
jgi:hypothetical protein